MPSTWRRYEILVPLQFNDGSEIPAAWLGEATAEVFEHFGGVSFETQVIEGQWRSGGTTYRDELAKLVIDVPATAENRRWMKACRDRWKVRFRQVAIWLVSFTITVE